MVSGVDAVVAEVFGKLGIAPIIRFIVKGKAAMMPIHPANGDALSRALQGLESWLDRWLGEGGRTFVRLAIAALLPLLIFGILAALLAAERTTRANTRTLAVQLATRSAEAHLLGT